MELKEVIEKRYSIRTFKDIEVPDKKIEEVFELARLAPSSGNLQSFRVIVVKDSHTKKKLYSRIDAPVILVICAIPEDQAVRYGDRGRNLYSVQDATIFAAYCQLIIVNMGLASVWVGAFRESKVREILELDDSLRPIALIHLGYPAIEKSGRRKKEVKNIIYKYA